MTNEERAALVERLRYDWPEIIFERHWMMDSDAIDKQRTDAADQIEADGKRIAELEEQADETAAALEQVIDATRSYLPPDGISERECINRILAATDNPKINKVMKEMGR